MNNVHAYLSTLPMYHPGTSLEENEYLLKVKFRHSNQHPDFETPIGFLTKLTKDGKIPKAFETWPRGSHQELMYVHTEVFSYGWKILGFRFGESQNWARMLHPRGFVIEIYADSTWNKREGLSLIEVISTSKSIVNGNIDGLYQWRANTLIPYPESL